nr:zinc finger, CCHC-type [Tanacetum cinerariifolium]
MRGAYSASELIILWSQGKQLTAVAPSESKAANKKEYRPVSKNSTASSSGNKKKGVEPTIEVSNSNLFGVLNLVYNDMEFGTNGGTTNLVNNEATSSGSSFMHIDNDGEFASNTPIVPTGIVESDSEVEVVFGDTANLKISTSGKDISDKGYGTSLLEQWRDSYLNNNDYNPYDDDMYENHDLSEHLQSMCDDLDITVHEINHDAPTGFDNITLKDDKEKMHFLLSSMSVVYVLTTHIPEDGGDDPTIEQVRKRAKWDMMTMSAEV